MASSDAEHERQLAKRCELRKMFNDAGVNIHIHKMGFGQSDEEIDFSFLVAKALGRTQIDSRRLPGGRAQRVKSSWNTKSPKAPTP